MPRLSDCHPLVSAFFFFSVLFFAMFSGNPVLTGISLIGGVLFCFRICPEVRSFRAVAPYCCFVLLVTLVNPLVSHNGATPLLFLNGDPVTLESLLYGINLGVMLVSVFFWFRCLREIMTEDKLLDLFGRLSPKLALVLSTALRFLPRIRQKAQSIREAQKSLGLYAEDVWISRWRGTVRVFSATVTWILENAVETGTFMRARGYGLPGRTRFSLFQFRRRDAVLLAFLLLLDSGVLCAMIAGRLSYQFFPRIVLSKPDLLASAAILLFSVLCLLPVLLEGKEDLRWRFYRSRI